MPNKAKREIIVGLDEVGRGALAGPVVAVAATITTAKLKVKNLKSLKDSKRLSPKKREEVFELLKNCPEIKWGTGRVSEKAIDKINILQATKLAMEKAVMNLKKEVKGSIVLLLIDGNFTIKSDVIQKSIIKGDEKVFLIKIASIIAKVTRDKIMVNYHKKYPQYNFDKHKAYGTKLHFQRLKKYGPCPIHRKTFSPVKPH